MSWPKPLWNSNDIISKLGQISSPFSYNKYWSAWLSTATPFHSPFFLMGDIYELFFLFFSFQHFLFLSQSQFLHLNDEHNFKFRYVHSLKQNLELNLIPHRAWYWNTSYTFFLCFFAWPMVVFCCSFFIPAFSFSDMSFLALWVTTMLYLPVSKSSD